MLSRIYALIDPPPGTEKCTHIRGPGGGPFYTYETKIRQRGLTRGRGLIEDPGHTPAGPPAGRLFKIANVGIFYWICALCLLYFCFYNIISTINTNKIIYIRCTRDI